MRYFAYLLLFENGYLYTGSTSSPGKRERKHQRFGGRPKILWRQSFASRQEAYAREVQLKGWTRAKKLALAQGDLALLTKLSKRRGGKALPIPEYQSLFHIP